jgi:hypothetical protein
MNYGSNMSMWARSGFHMNRQPITQQVQGTGICMMIANGHIPLQPLVDFLGSTLTLGPYSEYYKAIYQMIAVPLRYVSFQSNANSILLAALMPRLAKDACSMNDTNAALLGIQLREKTIVKCW